MIEKRFKKISNVLKVVAHEIRSAWPIYEDCRKQCDAYLSCMCGYSKGNPPIYTDERGFHYRSEVKSYDEDGKPLMDCPNFNTEDETCIFKEVK